MTINTLDSLTKVSRKFLEIIEQENELLEENQLAEVSELLSQKRALASEYETQVYKFLNSPQKDGISEEDKAVLLKLVEELKEKIQCNEQSLLIALKANKKFLDVVVKSAKKSGVPNCYYTKRGFFRKNPNNISMMSLDTRF